jgi:amino acid transporter
VYALLATIGTLAIILVYILLCVGGMVFFKRTSRRYNPLIHALVPLVGAVIFAAAWYGSVYPAPSAPINVAPYVAAAWLVVGLVFLAVLRIRRPGAVERIGEILGEEGGQEGEPEPATPATGAPS